MKLIIVALLVFSSGALYAGDAATAETKTKPKAAQEQKTPPLVQPGAENDHLRKPAPALSAKELLFKAANEGSVVKIQEALSKGATVHAKSSGLTALMVAARECHADAVKFLLEKGASPAATDKKGHTALWLAEHQNYCDAKAVIALLKETPKAK
jgi:ankyrin repeat protein